MKKVKIEQLERDALENKITEEHKNELIDQDIIFGQTRRHFPKRKSENQLVQDRLMAEKSEELLKNRLREEIQKKAS